ncbi:MAG: toll/interleukin-1 receptor domain-containing protein [Longimicrobiaceae bacterium]
MILSPIPYRRWPRTARLSLFIQHKPEEISRISRFLAEQGVSIVQSESARAAYRYEVWSFYVVLGEDGARSIPGEYSEKHKVYSGTYQRLLEIKRRLREEFQDILFTDQSDLELRRPVQVLPNTALARFHRTAEDGKDGRSNRPAWVHGPLQFRCTGAGTLTPGSEGLFTAILKSEEHATPKTRCERRLLGDVPMKLLPSIAYATLDTRYLSLRLAILPEHLRKQFFEFSVTYQRTGPPDHSRGLIAALTGRLPRHYNIWSSVHRTLESTEYFERGQVVMLIEDQGIGDDCDLHPTEESCVSLAERALMGLEGEKRLSELLRLTRDGGLHYGRKDAEGTVGNDGGETDGLSCGDGPTDGGAEQKRVGPVHNDDPLITLDKPGIKSVTKRRVRRKLELQRAARGGPHVFLSYSHEDSETAEKIHKALTDVGLEVYKADREQDSGDEFSITIRSKLLGCRELWVLCTSASMKSEWVQTEWGAAWALEKRIVPVVLHKEDRERLPMRLRNKQTVLFTDIEQFARQAVIRIDTAQLG